MTFNKRVDRLESGPNNPKSPNDEVIWVDTENNSIKRYNESNSSWVSVGGSGGNANIADFVFDYNEDEGYVSSMTIANHDMVIETTRDDGQDADISITSADDIWITAGDEIEIDAGDTIDIRSDTDHVRIVSDRTINNNEWTFETNGGLRFPDSTVQTTAYTGGASVSFTVPTAFKDSDGDDFITFTRTSTGTARIGTPQDDLSLRSARDITLIAGDDGPGNVYIGWGDATITPDASNRVATIGDIQSASSGSITFDGVEIRGAGTASGDGLGAGTMELVPDSSLNSDQYLIIDPTGPNHIHIRAGGNQDDSTADLIFGGERNKVLVSDTERLVLVSTRPPGEEASENQWVFGSDGLLTGPAPDSLIKVNGLYGKDTDPLLLLAPDTVVISGDGGEFLDDPTVADNQIATIGDLPTGATGTFETPDSKLVTVTNGIITAIDPLT
jgi:hypothetical protein